MPVSLQVIGSSSWLSDLQKNIYQYLFFVPSPNFPIMIVPTQVARFKKSVPYFCPSPSPGVCLEILYYILYIIVYI